VQGTFTRGAVIVSLPVQHSHSLRKQPRGPWRKQMEMGAHRQEVVRADNCPVFGRAAKADPADY